MKCCRVHVTGVVQGVGFRPFVAALAIRLQLSGWVRNTSSGVDLVVEGTPAGVDAFLDQLRQGGPSLARVEGIDCREIAPEGHRRFAILESRPQPGTSLPVSPDVASCADCLREMRHPADRRHRYPFVNCTQCGPRFTILRDIPYDRPRTTMAAFALCSDCAAEYADPSDRRYHAQPLACPACGPRLWLEAGGVRRAEGDAALLAARQLLARGAILAVKGLGGFHLACDATNVRAVTRLRANKRREGKPFALMAAGIDAVARHAVLDSAAQALLESAARPIVLLERQPRTAVPAAVAPGRTQLGFMLPYTPLHHLLLEPASGFPDVLVMTSGNRSDEPIAYADEDARRRLAGLADAFLFHDRPIHVRCDDSVVTSFRGQAYFLRRSRGYTPLPLPFPPDAPPLLAVGGEFKNTFCLTRAGRAFLGPHIGELAYLEAMRSFASGVEHFERLFRIRPECIVNDLHPDYRSTRYALERARREGLPALAVQHHHAHIAACMADNGLGAGESVLGVAFDGTGFGTDGASWGGEFLVASLEGFERALHLSYCPLPGGDAAVGRPYRTALSWMRTAGVGWDDDLPPVHAATPEELGVLEAQLDKRINAPPTSSAGRLFDAAASLAGVRHRITYEAQAACEFEAAADAAETGGYPFTVGPRTLDPAPALQALAADVRRRVPVPAIAARFHNGLGRAVVDACRMLREISGLQRVALSGGVWQNLFLLRRTVEWLQAAGFRVLVHRQVPANDGGLALGQAAVAAVQLQRGVAPVLAESAAPGRDPASAAPADS